MRVPLVVMLLASSTAAAQLAPGVAPAARAAYQSSLSLVPVALPAVRNERQEADPADSLYRAARNALNKSQFKTAVELFRQVRAKYPKSTYVPEPARDPGQQVSQGRDVRRCPRAHVAHRRAAGAEGRCTGSGTDVDEGGRGGHPAGGASRPLGDPAGGGTGQSVAGSTNGAVGSDGAGPHAASGRRATRSPSTTSPAGAGGGRLLR